MYVCISLSLSLYIYIYIYTYIPLCVYVRKENDTSVATLGRVPQREY